MQITAPALVVDNFVKYDSLAIKEISLSNEFSRVFIPIISLEASPSSYAPRISASWDNLKLFREDTKN